MIARLHKRQGGKIMKKFLRWILIILAVLIVLYFVHSLITAKVYFDIYTAMSEKVNNSEDFYSRIQIPMDTDYEVTQEVFIKDNVFIKSLKRVSKDANNVTTLKLWQKYLPNKTAEEDGTGYIFIDAPDGTKKVEMLPYQDVKEPENKMYRYELSKSLVLGQGLSDFFPIYTYDEDLSYTYSAMLLNTLKHPTILYSKKIDGESCYAIKHIFPMGNFLYEVEENITLNIIKTVLFGGRITYISKETKLPVGVDDLTNPGFTKLEYFTKEVTDEDIKLPNLEEYTLQERN